MVTATMNIPAKKILQFQELVKQHNLRFSRFGRNFYTRKIEQVVHNGNTIVDSDFYVITVSGDVDNFNEFNADWIRMNTNIVEKTRPQSFIRMLKRFLGI